MVCKLLKTIYGLKQASRSWNMSFDKGLTLGKTNMIHAFIVRTDIGYLVFLVLHVDDILVMGYNI